MAKTLSSFNILH